MNKHKPYHIMGVVKEMMHMSKTMYDYTQEQIYKGFESHNQLIIEKETDFIFNKLINNMVTVFHDKIDGIKLSSTVFTYSDEYLFSEKHKKNLLKWLDRLVNLESPISDLDFGKIKIDFENWYYQLGGENIEFVFQKSYLLTPQEAADALGVSKVTLNKYIKQGLECLDNGSHNKIPKYAVEIMRDPVYSILMQHIAQERKIRNQSPKERLAEIYAEIADLQYKYSVTTPEEAFGAYNGDEMDDPTDYYRWKDLVEESKEIIKLGGGGHSIE